MGKAAVGL